MVDWARETWTSHFPAREGYAVKVESPAGRGHGVQLRVSRGDFQAAVEIENALVPSTRHPSESMQVRMFGRAESTALKRTEARASGIVLTGRQAGGLLGFFAAVVLPPIPLAGMVLLGVMFWAVLILAATILGGAFGGWLAERLVENAHRRVREGATVDPHLQHDLRRWKALARRMAAQRSTLTEGLVAGQPFRSLRGARG